MGDALHCCPECGDSLSYNAKSCSCGWKSKADPRRVMANLESDYSRSVMEATREAGKWLKERGLVAGSAETHQDHMRRLAAFREKLRKTPRPPMRQWAYDIIQRNEDGEMVPIHSLELARAAIKEFEAHEMQ